MKVFRFNDLLRKLIGDQASGECEEMFNRGYEVFFFRCANEVLNYVGLSDEERRFCVEVFLKKGTIAVIIRLPKEIKSRKSESDFVGYFGGVKTHANHRICTRRDSIH